MTSQDIGFQANLYIFRRLLEKFPEGTSPELLLNAFDDVSEKDKKKALFQISTDLILSSNEQEQLELVEHFFDYYGFDLRRVFEFTPFASVATDLLQHLNPRTLKSMNLPDWKRELLQEVSEEDSATEMFDRLAIVGEKRRR